MVKPQEERDENEYNEEKWIQRKGFHYLYFNVLTTFLMYQIFPSVKMIFHFTSIYQEVLDPQSRKQWDHVLV